MEINNDDIRSRSESFDSNQTSTCNFSTTVYDSGNFSSSNISEISSSIDFHSCALVKNSVDPLVSETDCNSAIKFHDIIREKDQSLIQAFQDIRKLKSELERLSKSEKWYKVELKNQKNARRELVEKLYMNEREHVRQTQHLHSECAKLQTICNDLKKQLKKENHVHLKEINELKSQPENAPTNSISVDFQNKQYANIIEDQKIIIDVLRNQKQKLLNDLNVLENEKDLKIFDLQKDNAELVTENRHLTKQCLQLIETRTTLEEQLLFQENFNKKLEDLVDSQQQQTVLSMANDINSNICLQEENNSLLRQNELMQLEIKKLDESSQMALQEKQLEIENLKIFEQNNSEHLKKLEKQITSLHDIQHEFENIIERKDVQLKQQSIEIDKLTSHNQVNMQLKNTISNLNERISSQSSELLILKNIEQEFLVLNEKYNKIYKLCEKLNFDTDLKAIEVKKLKFERDNSYKEVRKLRDTIKETSIQEEVFKRNKIELHKLKLQLEESQMNNIDYLTKINKLKDDLRICEENKQIITNKNLELNETIRNLCKEFNLNKKNLKELKTTLETGTNYKNLLKSSKEQISKLENELKKVQGERENCALNLIKMKKENAILKNQMQMFQKKFHNLRHFIINESHNENEKNCEVGKKRIEALQLLLNQQSSKVTHLDRETNEWTNFLEYLLTVPHSDEHTSTLANTLNDESVESSNENYKTNLLTLQNDVKNLNSQICCLKKFNENSLGELNAVIRREHENAVQLETLHLSLIEFLTNNKEHIDQEFLEIQRKNKYFEEQKENSNGNVSSHFRSEKLKILEMNYRKKTDQFESHILTLLNNIKFYKNNLQITEERYGNFFKNYQESEEAYMQFKMPCEQCKSIDVKYQDCLQTINILQSQLETASNQFVEIDMYKEANSKLKQQLSNLLCDYKKLIQFIPKSTKYSINQIDVLINRSEKSVPNLMKLSSSVDGLKDDIQKLLQTTISAGRSSPLVIQKKSLMYELKQAEVDFISCT